MLNIELSQRPPTYHAYIIIYRTLFFSLSLSLSTFASVLLLLPSRSDHTTGNFSNFLSLLLILRSVPQLGFQCLPHALVIVFSVNGTSVFAFFFFLSLWFKFGGILLAFAIGVVLCIYFYESVWAFCMPLKFVLCLGVVTL